MDKKVVLFFGFIIGLFMLGLLSQAIEKMSGENIEENPNIIRYENKDFDEVYGNRYIIYGEAMTEEESIKYILNFLGDNNDFVRLFYEDLEYINYFPERSLVVSSYEKCNLERTGCIRGSHTIEDTKIYWTTINHPNEMIEVFLHEVAHLLMLEFFSQDDFVEWVNIYINSEFTTHYSMNGPEEDFAESYMFYRLGKELPQNKKEFIEKIERRARNTIK